MRKKTILENNLLPIITKKPEEENIILIKTKKKSCLAKKIENSEAYRLGRINLFDNEQENSKQEENKKEDENIEKELLFLSPQNSKIEKDILITNNQVITEKEIIYEKSANEEIIIENENLLKSSPIESMILEEKLQGITPQNYLIEK